MARKHLRWKNFAKKYGILIVIRFYEEIHIYYIYIYAKCSITTGKTLFCINNNIFFVESVHMALCLLYIYKYVYIIIINIVYIIIVHGGHSTFKP